MATLTSARPRANKGAAMFGVSMRCLGRDAAGMIEPVGCGELGGGKASQWSLVGAAVVGLGWLGLYRVPHNSRRIEHGVFERSMQKLKAANITIPDGALLVDGRDV